MGATCTSAGHTFPLAICGNDSPSRKEAKRSKLLPAYFGVPLRDLVRYERTYLGIVSPKDLAHFPPLMDEKPSSKASMPEEDANRDLALVESQVAVARGLTLSVHRITPPPPDKVKASGEQNQVFCEGAVDYVPLFLQAVAFWWGSEANATNNTQSTTAPLQAAVPNVVMDRSALATRPEMWAALVETHVNSLVPGSKYKKQLRKASAGARKSSESKVKRWFRSAFKQRGERPRMDFLKLKIERDEYRRQHQVPSATMPVDPLPAEEALRTLTGARLFEETMTLFYPPVTRGEGIPPPCALRLLRVYLQRLPEPLVPLSCTNLLETYLGTVGYLNSEDDTDVEDGAPHQKPDSTGVMLTVDEILRSNFAHIRPTAYCTMVFLLRLLRSHRLTLTDSDMVPVLVDSIRSPKSPRVIQYLLSHHIHELQPDAVVTEDRSVQEAWSEVSETIPLDVPISAEVTREAEADAGSGTSGKEVREGDDDDAVVSAARAVPAEETASAGGEKADLQALPARRRRRRTRQPGHTGEGTSNAEESSILPDNSQSSAAADEAPVANSTAPLAPEVLPEAIEERVATATVVEVAESKPKPVANVEADEKERTDCKVSMPQSPDTRLTMESDDASSCSSAFPCAPQLAATAVAKRDEATKRPTKSILRMQPPSDDDTTTDDLSEADNAAAETCVTATTQAGTQSSLPTLLDGTALSPLRHSDGVNTTMPPASSVGESGLNLPTSTPASPEPEKLLSEKSSPQLLPAPVLLPPAMSTPPPPPLEVPAVPSSAPELPSHSLSVEEEEDLVGVGHAISHHTGKSLPSPYKEVKGLAQRRPSFAGSASQTDTVNIADISPVKRNNSSILPPSQMEEEEEFQGFKLHSHSTSQNTPLPTRAPHSSGSNPVTGASATPSSPSSGSFHPISTDAPTAAITGPLAIPVALATQPMPVVASDAQKGVVLPAPTPHPLVNTDSVHPAGVRLTPTKLDNNLKLSSQGSHSTPAETSAPNRLPLWTDRNVRAVLPSVEPLRVQKENRCLAALLEAKQRFIGNTPRGHLSGACLSPPRAAQTVSTSRGATPPKQLVDAMTEMADEDVELLKSSSAKPTRASAVAAATQTADQSTAAAPAAQAVMQADQGTAKLQELTDELQHIRAQMERRELQHKEAQMVVQEVTARCAELERERISSERDRRVEAAKLRELQMFVDQCKGDQTKLRMELANVQTQSALLRQALVTVH